MQLVFKDSILKLSPIYLAKKNPVMFTVEIGFFLVLGMIPFVGISEFVTHDSTIYISIAAILILTVWFATYSEALSEAQAQAKVDSLKSLEKEVFSKKLEDEKEILVSSYSLKVGDRVRVYAGEIIPRDSIVVDGKAFIDESMMTGESNPTFKEKDDPVIGGTKVANDNITIEITAEAGKSYLDEMVGLIQNAKRPKTQNEIALTILLAGLSLIFIAVVGTMFFFASYLGYDSDIAVLIALLVALLPTTIGGLLPAIGISGITRIARDNLIVKSGKGIEAAGDCDVLILDKTGTITEGTRRAVQFIPMENYTENDVIQAAFAASFNDSTFEAKSIIELAEEKNIEPPLLDQILTARPIPFSSETKFSGIEFIRGRKFVRPQTDSVTRTRVSEKLCSLAESDSEVRILKGSVDAIVKIAPSVNEAEMRWKSQEISKNGGTPLLVSINDEIIGLVSLKDNLKENIREKINEVKLSGINTIMITGDTQITARSNSKRGQHRPSPSRGKAN